MALSGLIWVLPGMKKTLLMHAKDSLHAQWAHRISERVFFTSEWSHFRLDSPFLRQRALYMPRRAHLQT